VTTTCTLAILGDDYLHTRYTLDGHEGTDDWPNFQFDGFGTWLWALIEHLRLTAGHLPSHWREAINLTSSYLAALWRIPCLDLWEEHLDNIHPYTLSAIYAGLRAAGELTGHTGWLAIADEIRRFVLEHCVQDGHLVKYVGSEATDASLLGVATPYRLLAPDDPIMRATVARIEADLRHQAGGVHRYADDTYYGGGEWVLLTAWLGWYYVEVGEQARARELLAWVEAQADEEGNLPEQVPQTLNNPPTLQPWVERWGPIASPLLWSHAMYLILLHAQAFALKKPPASTAQVAFCFAKRGEVCYTMLSDQIQTVRTVGRHTHRGISSCISIWTNLAIPHHFLVLRQPDISL